MLIGFNAPVAAPLAKPEALTRITTEGETMGFDHLAFCGHIARSTRSGVSDFDFGFSGSSTDEMLTTMERSRDEVLARA